LLLANVQSERVTNSTTLEHDAREGLKGSLFHGFTVPKDSLSRSKKQLTTISKLNEVQKQFIGTMLDTEVAAGYFLRKSNVTGNTWSAYVAVKMKYGGDLFFFAKLIARLPPSRGWYANTIKQSLDRRWSLNIQGIVAYALLKEARPYLHNEKTIAEVDCILRHGPTVDGKLSHPFIQCGAIHVRRGVWYWPQIDDRNNGENGVHSR